jgi:hypothetical protein
MPEQVGRGEEKTVDDGGRLKQKGKKRKGRRDEGTAHLGTVSTTILLHRNACQGAQGMDAEGK